MPAETQMKSIREKPHRLAAESYRGYVAVSFTACVKNRTNLFVDRGVVDTFKRILFEEARRYLCEIPAFTFMPDHCHVILMGTSESADPLAAMKSFKHKTGYWLYEHQPSASWQKDFFDHIVRDEEELEKHVLYIFENPVRKSLVSDWKTYPFSGSSMYDLENW